MIRKRALLLRRAIQKVRGSEATLLSDTPVGEEKIVLIEHTRLSGERSDTLIDRLVQNAHVYCAQQEQNGKVVQLYKDGKPTEEGLRRGLK